MNLGYLLFRTRIRYLLSFGLVLVGMAAGPVWGFAQEPAQDQTDTGRSAWLDTALRSREPLTDSMLQRMAALIQAAKNKSDWHAAASLSHQLARRAQNTNNHTLAAQYFQLAAQQYARLQRPDSQASMLVQTAFELSLLNRLDSAFGFLIEAHQAAEKTQDVIKLAEVQLQITRWFHHQSDYEEALQYSQRAVATLRRQRNDSLRAEAEYLHGFGLMRTQRLSEAIVHFTNSQKLFKRLDELDGQARVLDAIAGLMAAEGKHLVAFKNYRRSIELMAQSQNYTSMYRTYINFAGLLLRIRNDEQALRIFDLREFHEEHRQVKTYLSVGVFWAKQQRDLEYQQLGYKYLTRLYLDEKDFANGLRLNASYDSVRELAYNEQRLKIEQVKRSYDNQRKDQRIFSLEKDHQLAELEVERNKLINYLLVSLLGIVAIVSVGIYHRNQERKAVNRQLLRKNVEIETQRRTLQNQNEELRAKNEMIQQQRDALQRAMEDLKKTQSRLVHSERLASIYQLTAGLVHEINNPVNAISGGVQSLAVLLNDLNEMLQLILSLDQSTTQAELVGRIIEQKEHILLQDVVDDIRALLRSINNGTERTHAIINSLKIFSQMDDNKFRTTRIEPILREATQRLLEKTNKVVELDYQIDSQLSIACYPELLSTAFQNVVQNAIDALPTEGGRVQVAASVQDERVQLTLADNGCGMSEETRQRAFEPFFSTKPIGQGTGLGLALAHGIVEKHEGRITLQSTPGKGTVVTISIPRQ